VVDSRHSPVIYGYLKKYQDDPNSRVFAPLAESYRKAGLIDEAIEIAREGLRIHPSFIGGRVALARALFDKKQYENVIQELSQVVFDAPDNLVAQRLLAESCLMQGRVTEALGAFKMLLYYNPGDTETAQMVSELETQVYEQGTLILRTDRPPQAAVEDEPEFDIRQAPGAINEAPAAKRALWIRRVELLQGLLQRVERYKTNQASGVQG